MKLQAHHAYDDEDPSRVIASIHPASSASVALVAKAHEDNPDGRSQFVWVRLPNGDLILGVFPQGDTYLACEEDAQYKVTP